ncbi:MAG: ABC transporter ATP-binding protein [Lachnospiraceae bacterium]|nr:ABC transporter ATP-binding protein [Lachnospiraceae bacterium]
MGKKKRSNLTKQILKNNIYAVRLTASLSKKRVIVSIVKQIIEYLMWVFYSAFFVRYILDAIENEKETGDILLAVLVIGTVSLLLELFLYYCGDVLFPLLDIKVFHGLYEKVYKKSENMEIACFETSDFYDKFSVALDDMGNKLCDTVDNMSAVIGGTIGGILACYTMVEIDPLTIVFLIAPLIGNFFFAPKMNEIYYKRYLDAVPFERKLMYVNRIMYLPEYVKELRLSNIFHVISRQYHEAIEGKASIWKRYFNKAFILGILQYVFSYMVIFEGILLYGGYRALVSQENRISFSQMAVLTSVMVTASWVWVRVINAINRGTQNSMLIANLKEFMNYEEKIPENQDGLHPDANITSIKFENVSFSYDGEKNILHNVSFEVEGKKSIVFVGHNGAGKSTIIKLLLRLYDPTEGRIYVNGRDIREYNLAEYRNLFACAFQDGVIIPGTIKSNVLMGREGTDEQVLEVLKLAGIYDKINSLPEGIHTVLTKEFDDNGALLSGGEYQKIVVARAFAKTAQIGIFDEPSSALDPVSEDKLFSSILKASEDKITVLISHRLSCVKDADYVYMMEQGEMIEQGTHDTLLQKGGKYAEMYRIQEKNYFALDDEGEVAANE